MSALVDVESWLEILFLLQDNGVFSFSGKAVMAPNLDSFGRDRAAYQEVAKQRRIAEREARRYANACFFQ